MSEPVRKAEPRLEFNRGKFSNAGKESQCCWRSSEDHAATQKMLLRMLLASGTRGRAGVTRV
jgi:hypothetical protein